ncbi:MAG: ABC transporter substrate-binding protein [Candidatus Sumerlaeota bacterium]|nr:ABC transporter substrate-binding protein [Candidatus Sumerlaeota bacterium]
MRSAVAAFMAPCSGFEADAMKAVVDLYNKRQNKIWVNYLSTSQIDRKLLLATAVGNPPDVAGFWSYNMANFADKGALMTMDRLMKRDGLSVKDYLPAFGALLQYRGFVWALPTTPATVALHYNKRLFREAGLDPEKPPRTLQELWDYSEKLTKRDAKGNLTQLGFTPNDPGWWNPLWPVWFGGRILKDEWTVNCASKPFIDGLKWARSYPDHYGLKNMIAMQASGGGFDSAQNVFIAEKLAMQLQGVWMGNFIEKYNPKLEWGAAPFPVAMDNTPDVTVAEADLIIIPRGCKHVEEAWDFIKFTQTVEAMELLCMGQRKFSPLMRVTPGFYETHPNPYIKLFRRLAESPNAYTIPSFALYNEYQGEMSPAFEAVWLGQKTPEEAMKSVFNRIQPRMDKQKAQWERIKDQRLKQWSEE